ncbi:protein kinase domain-containing protein [Streptomyces sp. NPDC004561]
MGENRLVQGRYRLLELIGRGGMGEVWRARDESLGRRVAVKCLRPPGPYHDPSFTRVLRERFRREARVAAALSHRGVTVVHDFGESDGVPYLVMELLEGHDLSRLLADNKGHPLPVDDVLDIAGQVAAALAYTHRQGIVHRDLKPANIVRLTDGTVKICDFGIARLGHDIGFTARLTGTGVALGTPHYMSPEQIGGDAVDRRSDLYSLGCVLYEIATGAPPFDLDDAWAILIGHRDTPPRPPRERRPELPARLDRVILALLAKRPEERPYDAEELVHLLRPGRTTTAHLPTVPPTRPPGGEPGRLTTTSEPAFPEPHRTRLPSWTQGMTTGHKAMGAPGAGLPALPPDPGAALTGRWATGPAGAAVALLTGPAPHTLAALTARHHEGVRLAGDGRWAEAGEVYRAVAAERAALLGPDHPETLASRYEAAFTLVRTGRAPEALPLYTDITAARTRTLGADHPDTLAARYESALSLGRLGRSAEALRRYRELIDDRTRVQGPDHPETLRARHGLGVNLGRLGRWEEAFAEAREVCALRARVLGPDHPDTLVSHREIAVALGWLGRWPDALTEYRRVAAARERVLGADHPDTLAGRNDEAHCLQRLGRDAEAGELYRRIAAHHQRRASAGP